MTKRFIRLMRKAMLASAAFTSILNAQIATDGTVGPARSLTGPNFQVTADLGQIHSGNLFHSFSEFNVHTGESATFSGPASVTNILTRVTGGNASSINGLLKSEIANANLFLMNPNGVLIGDQAHLDVSGSFAVTTADVINFTDTAQFAAQPNPSEVLTSSAPASFGFLGTSPSGIDIDGGRLHVPGRTLSVVGGRIRITNDAEITAAAGQINIVSVGSEGVVTTDATAVNSPVTLSGFNQLAAISLDDSTISTTGERGGRIVIQGRNLDADDSGIVAGTTGTGTGLGVSALIDQTLSIQDTVIGAGTSSSGDAGPVDIQADVVEIHEFATIENTASDTGNGGPINITANTLLIEATDAANMDSNRGDRGEDNHNQPDRPDPGTVVTGLNANTFGSGTGGNISINVTDLSVHTGGRIASDTLIDGRAGEIHIQATEIVIDGRGAEISAQTFGPSVNAIGGGIRIEGTTLSLLNGGSISTSTSGAAHGGEILIDLQNALILQGLSPDAASAIRSETTAAFVGSQSDLVVTLDVTHPSVSDVTIVLANPDGSALPLIQSLDDDGANLTQTVLTDDATLPISSGEAPFTGTFRPAQSFGPFVNTSATGTWRLDVIDTVNGNQGSLDGWTLSIGGQPFTSEDTPLAINDFQVVRSNIQVQAPDLIVGGTRGEPIAGNAGSVTINAPSVQLLGASTISVVTSGSGSGGDVQINTADMLIAGGAVIDAATTGEFTSGIGGDVTVNSRNLTIQDGSFLSTSTSGVADGGSVSLNVTDALTIAGGNDAETGIQAESTLIVQSAFGTSFTIEHPSVSELGVFLISPQGTRVPLADHLPQGGANFTGTVFADGAPDSLETAQAPFASAFRPEPGFASFLGEAATGDWILEIVNDSATDAATLKGWGIATDMTDASIGNANIVVPAGETVTSIITLPPLGNSDPVTEFVERRGHAVGGMAGDVDITAGSVLLTGAGRITTSTLGEGRGGDISLVSTGPVSLLGPDPSSRLTGHPLIAAGSVSPALGGQGGQILLEGMQVVIRNGGEITTQTSSDGDGGNIHLVAHDLFEIEERGTVTAGTSGSGNAGDLVITTKTFRIGGPDARVIADSRGPGSSGLVSITGDLVQLSDGARISGDVFGTGAGREVRITATDVVVDGIGSVVSARTSSSETQGVGGNVVVDAVNLSLTDGGSISTSTDGAADSGNISINLSGLLFMNGSELESGRSSSINVDTTATLVGGTSDLSLTLTMTHSDIEDLTVVLEGPTGEVARFLQFPDVDATQLIDTTFTDDALTRIDEGEEPFTASFRPEQSFATFVDHPAFGDWNLEIINFIGDSTGTLESWSLTIGDQVYDAPGLPVTVDRLSVTRSTIFVPDTSLIVGGTRGEPIAGNGGEIVINAREIVLEDAATITGATFGSGRGGNVTINAQDAVTLIGDDARIIGDTQSRFDRGDGGTVTLTTNTLNLLSGGTISTSTNGAGEGGLIDLSVHDRLLITSTGDDASSIRAESTLTLEANLGTGVVINHPALDELQVSLTSPTGRSVVLARNIPPGGSPTGLAFHDRADDRVDEASPPVTGIYRPIEPLAKLIGEPVEGDWVIEVTDNASGNDGALILGGIKFGGDDEITDTPQNPLISNLAPTKLTISIPQPPADQHSTVTRLSRVTGGNAGDINISARVVRLVGNAVVSSSTRGEGSAGSINIHGSEEVVLRTYQGGIPSISTSTSDLALSNAGDVTINAGRRFGAFGSLIAASASQDGGNININATDVVAFDDSTITAKAGQDGARISIDPLLVVVRDSTINGEAGNVPVQVSIITDLFVKRGNSLILTNTAEDLTIAETDIAVPIYILESVFATSDAELQDSCFVIHSDDSRFSTTGRSGLPLSPAGWLPSYEYDPRDEREDSPDR